MITSTLRTALLCLSVLGASAGCKEVQEGTSEVKAGFQPMTPATTTVGIEKVSPSTVEVTKEAHDGKITFSLAKALKKFPTIAPYISPDSKVFVLSSDQANLNKRAIAKRLKLPKEATFDTERVRAETNITAEIFENKMTGTVKWWMDVYVLEQLVAKKVTDNTISVIANTSSSTTGTKNSIEVLLVGTSLVKKEKNKEFSAKTVEANKKLAAAGLLEYKKTVTVPAANIPIFGIPKLGFSSQLDLVFSFSFKHDVDHSLSTGYVSSFIPTVTGGFSLKMIKFEAAMFTASTNGDMTLVNASYPVSMALGGSTDRKSAKWSSFVTLTPKWTFLDGTVNVSAALKLSEEKVKALVKLTEWIPWQKASDVAKKIIKGKKDFVFVIWETKKPIVENIKKSLGIVDLDPGKCKAEAVEIANRVGSEHETSVAKHLADTMEFAIRIHAGGLKTPPKSQTPECDKIFKKLKSIVK